MADSAEEKAAAKAAKEAEKEAAKAAAKAAKETSTATETISGIEVGDPQLLRPVELPLVIKTPEGGWANPEQEEYAQTLNGYAYRNPKKWGKKKVALVKQLATLGTDPSLIEKFRGGDSGVSYKDKRFQQ